MDGDRADRWQAAVNAEVQETRAEIDAAVGQVEKALGALDRLARVQRFIDNPNSVKVPPLRIGVTVAGVRATDVSLLLDTLRNYRSDLTAFAPALRPAPMAEV